MHEVFTHLSKRVQTTQKALAELIAEVERQAQREAKALEEAEYGSEFDAETSPVQEKVVSALQSVLEDLDAADEALTAARETLGEIPNL